MKFLWYEISVIWNFFDMKFLWYEFSVIWNFSNMKFLWYEISVIRNLRSQHEYKHCKTDKLFCTAKFFSNLCPDDGCVHKPKHEAQWDQHNKGFVIRMICLMMFFLHSCISLSQRAVPLKNINTKFWLENLNIRDCYKPLIVEGKLIVHRIWNIMEGHKLNLFL